MQAIQDTNHRNKPVKRVVLLLCSLLASMILATGASCQVVAVFNASHDFLTDRNGQYITQFSVDTDRETLSGIVSKAQLMPETLTLTTERIKRNKYQCSILYTYPTDPSYVKKVLIALGIEQMKLDNILFNVPDYNPVKE